MESQSPMASKTKYQQRTDLLLDVDTIRKEQKLRLADMLLSKLQPRGFSRVTKHFDGRRKSTLSILFERQHAEETCDWIEAVFCKYHGRKFQIHMGKSLTVAPYEHERTGSLVHRTGQLYYYWGARAWLPFRDAAFEKSVKRVSRIVSQAVDYLETGKAGPNITGREWTTGGLEEAKR